MNPLQTKLCVVVTIAGMANAIVLPALAEEAPGYPKADVLVCAKAFEQAQVLRNQAKYLAASQQALSCSQPKCGQALFTECSKLYVEFQEALPSVVLSASDGKGNELPDVHALIDGEMSIEQLDGRPINLDPGNHQFEFTAPGFSVVAKRMTLLAGERFRPVSVVFTATLPEPKTKAEPALAPAQSSSDTVTKTSRPIPTASYVLGGVGVVAVAGFVALRILGSSNYDQLERDCSPQCSDAEVNRARLKYTLSYTSLGIGAAALAGALGVYFMQPRTRSPLLGSAFIVRPELGGASAGIVTRF